MYHRVACNVSIVSGSHRRGARASEAASQVKQAYQSIYGNPVRQSACGRADGSPVPKLCLKKGLGLVILGFVCNRHLLRQYKML